MKPKIQIDVISDVACPWCYVGKKNLEKAIEKTSNYEVEVNWRPYQLDPNIPKEGVDQEVYLANKFGSLERYEQLATHLKTTGKKAGIEFKRAKRLPNTLSLHCLLHVASNEGFGNELKTAFFKALFEDQIDLTSLKELKRIMAEFGWEENKTEQVLADEEISYAVKMEINQAYNMQVAGVPYFVINNKYSLRGAQPSEVFEQALQDIGGEMQSEPDNTCSIDDPNC